MPSQFYTDLASRLAALRGNLLPSVRDDLQYTDEEYDRVRAYIVLAHAEIEEYIEKSVLEVVRRHLDAWDKQSAPSRALMGVIAFSKKEFSPCVSSLTVSLGDAKKPSWIFRDLTSRTRHCVQEYCRFVMKDNHGIRESNILQLLLPLGLSIDMIDEELIRNLDSFGQNRGGIAHQSARSVNTQPDPVDARNDVEGILKKLTELDDVLAKLT